MNFELDKIYNMDCMDVMKSLPNESIDLIVTDPPYLVTRRGSPGLHGMFKTKATLAGKVFKYNDIDIEEYLPQFYRILKERAHCYIMCNNYNLQHFMDVIQASSFNFCKMLIWDKGNVVANRYYMDGYEFIFFSYKGAAKKINNMGTSSVLRFRNKKSKDADGNNIHDCEKPVALFQCMIENSTKENEVVFDPFCGSGTAAIAAIRAGRRYICTELDSHYYDIAVQRILREREQPKLFDL